MHSYCESEVSYNNKITVLTGGWPTQPTRSVRPDIRIDPLTTQTAQTAQTKLPTGLICRQAESRG